jgi:hypothetical protein
MQITSPIWHLNVQCPCCGQGQRMLVSCSKCGHVAAECDEVGTFFPDARRLAPSESSRCARCGAAGSESFVLASSDQVQRAGFKPGEYQ